MNTSKSRHVSMPCIDRANALESAIDWQEPEAASAMLTPRSPNVPTPDTSFAAFLIEPEPGE